MTKKTPHPHSALITEWIKDINIIVQVKQSDGSWKNRIMPVWHPDNEYRLERKIDITSSLTDEELADIFWTNRESLLINFRKVANAAAQGAIKDFVAFMNRYEDGNSGDNWLNDFMEFQEGKL